MDHLLKMRYLKRSQDNIITFKLDRTGTYVYPTVLEASKDEYLILDELNLLLTRNDLSFVMRIFDGESYYDEVSGTAYQLLNYGMTDHAIQDKFYCFRYDEVHDIYGIRFKSFSTLYKPFTRMDIIFRGPENESFGIIYEISYFVGKLYRGDKNGESKT